MTSHHSKGDSSQERQEDTDLVENVRVIGCCEPLIGRNTCASVTTPVSLRFLGHEADFRTIKAVRTHCFRVRAVVDGYHAHDHTSGEGHPIVVQAVRRWMSSPVRARSKSRTPLGSGT